MDPALSWCGHIETMCNKLCSAVYAIRKINQTAGSAAATKAYYGLFSPILCYGLLAWCSASDTALRRIFIIQKWAIRSLTGAASRDHCRPLFKRMKIMSLYSLIVYYNLCYVRKRQAIYKCYSEQHSYQTRHRERFIIPFARLNKTKSRYLGLELYNSLPENIRMLPINKFVNILKATLVVNCLYNVQEFYDVAFRDCS